MCYNKSVKNSPIRSVFVWYGTDKVYSRRAHFVVRGKCEYLFGPLHGLRRRGGGLYSYPILYV